MPCWLLMPVFHFVLWILFLTQIVGLALGAADVWPDCFYTIIFIFCIWFLFFEFLVLVWAHNNTQVVNRPICWYLRIMKMAFWGCGRGIALSSLPANSTYSIRIYQFKAMLVLELTEQIMFNLLRISCLKNYRNIAYIYPTPPPWAGCNTRWIFMQSLTGLNTEFSFS